MTSEQLLINLSSVSGGLIPKCSAKAQIRGNPSQPACPRYLHV